MAHPQSAHFREQGRHCLPGSPMYAALLAQLADDLDGGGPSAAVMAPYRDDPADSAPALRLLAALHRLVLQRRAPELAMHYPSVGGTAAPARAWPVLRRVLLEQAEQVMVMAGEPVQTNEVGRCSALFGALYVLTARTGLPVRLLEIGSSAGLNLNVDRYAYAVGARVLGEPGSVLRLHEPWAGRPEADLSRPPVVVQRAGCDPRPIDAGTTEGRLLLTSFVWPDAADRLARLRAALAVATAHPVAVEPARAAPWLGRRLEGPANGVLTVIWHSVVLQYIDPAERVEIERIVAAAGARATPGAPLAMVGMEYEEGIFGLRQRTWPGGTEELLASTLGHGMPTTWAPVSSGGAPAGSMTA